MNQWSDNLDLSPTDRVNVVQFGFCSTVWVRHIHMVRTRGISFHQNEHVAIVVVIESYFHLHVRYRQKYLKSLLCHFPSITRYSQTISVPGEEGTEPFPNWHTLRDVQLSIADVCPWCRFFASLDFHIFSINCSVNLLY